MRSLIRPFATLTILLSLILASPALAVIAIGPTTNERLYLDTVDLCRDLMAIKARTQLLAERLYAIGIPNDPANGGQVPVEGFEDAVGLTKADVAAGVGVILDTKDFTSQLGRVQVCAQIMRNLPAQ